MGATFVELHTGRYSQACRLGGNVKKELATVIFGAQLGKDLGLKVHAGHGLTYENVSPVAALPQIEDLNIGHNIVAHASMVGLEKAVREMLALLKKARQSGR